MPKSFYPPVTLKKASAIPIAIFEKNAGKPIFRVTLAEELGFKSEARSFRDLITASSGYGLTSGSYASDRISLEQTGNEFAHGNKETAYAALFSIELFKKFYDNFASGGSRGIPSEKAARDFLKNDCSIPDSQTKAVLDNLIQDAKDWYLIQNIAGGDKFVPLDLAKEKSGLIPDGQIESDKVENTNHVEYTGKSGFQESAINKTSLDVSPNLQLNIEIHIDADTSDEKIETIFKNMRKYLLTNNG